MKFLPLLSTEMKKIEISQRDKRYFFAFLLFVFWFVLLQASGCDWVDGPLAFVRGCQNFGINWNSIIAPLGFVAIICLPVSILYFILRFCGVIKDIIMRIIRCATSS
jgi:hypothetical protein